MDKKKLITGAVVAAVFTFAVINVYTYYQEQKVIEQQAELDRIAHEKALALQRAEQAEKDRLKAIERAKRKQLEKEEAERLQKQRELERLEKERADAEAKRLKEEKRQKEIARKEAERQARIAEEEAERQRRQEEREEQKRQKELARERENIEEARRLRDIEGMGRKQLSTIRRVRPEQIREQSRDEVLNYRYVGKRGLGTRRSVLTEGSQSNNLMLFSAITQNIGVLEALIDMGLDVNSANEGGFTPLMFASAYNTPDIIQFLIDQGADMTARSKNDDFNALHVASALNPKSEVIDLLVKNGFDVNDINKDKLTPLMVASLKNRNLQIIEKLLDVGADHSIKNYQGEKAYLYLSERIKGMLETEEYTQISRRYDTELLERLSTNEY